MQIEFDEPMDTVDGLNEPSNYFMNGVTLPDTVIVQSIHYHYLFNNNEVNRDNMIDSIIVVTGPHLYKQFYRLEVNNVYDLAYNIINPDSNWYIYWVDSPVPVELSTFKVTFVKHGIVSLCWETATELNNYGFELQRAIEQKFEYFTDWKKIAFIEGHGNSNSPKEYNYTDTLRATKPLTVYYRLKQIDTDGQYEYSNVIKTTVDNVLSEPTLFVYPNPFNSEINIEAYFETAVNVTGIIFNLLGEEIERWVDNDIVGLYKRRMSFGRMSAGMYVFQLSTDEYLPLRVKILLIK